MGRSLFLAAIVKWLLESSSIREKLSLYKAGSGSSFINRHVIELGLSDLNFEPKLFRHIIRHGKKKNRHIYLKGRECQVSVLPWNLVTSLYDLNNHKLVTLSFSLWKDKLAYSGQKYTLNSYTFHV